MRLALLSVVLLLSSFHGFAAGNQVEKFHEKPAIKDACFQATFEGYNYVIFIPYKNGYRHFVFAKDESWDSWQPKPYMVGYSDNPNPNYTRYFPIGVKEGPFQDIKPDHSKDWPCPLPGNVYVVD